ncbi:MAG: glycosyltransferase, partial [Synechococcus sp.]
VGFFQDPDQLRRHALAILADPALQASLRQQGAAALQQPQNTYAARLQTILEWAAASPVTRAHARGHGEDHRLG